MECIFSYLTFLTFTGLGLHLLNHLRAALALLSPTVSSPVQKQVQGKLKSPGILEAPRRQPNPAQHTGAHTHPDLASWSQRTWTSLPLKQHSNLLQYSCLENPMDIGA